MKFKAIPDPISGLRQWYAYDSLAGIQAIIKPCSDDSGLIGRVSDFHTGDTLREFFGSSSHTVADAIDNYINSLVTKGLIASL